MTTTAKPPFKPVARRGASAPGGDGALTAEQLALLQEEARRSGLRGASAPAAAPPAVDLPLPQKQLSVELPEKLIRQLKSDAAGEGTTARVIILRGLRAIGYEIPDGEFRDLRTLNLHKAGR